MVSVQLLLLLELHVQNTLHQVQYIRPVMCWCYINYRTLILSFKSKCATELSIPASTLPLSASLPALTLGVGTGFRLWSAELSNMEVIPRLLAEAVRLVLISFHLDYRKSLGSGTQGEALLLSLSCRDKRFHQDQHITSLPVTASGETYTVYKKKTKRLPERFLNSRNH